LYYEDGTIQEDGYFKNGERHGLQQWYNEEGELTIEYEYSDGEKQGE